MPSTLLHEPPLNPVHEIFHVDRVLKPDEVTPPRRHVSSKVRTFVDFVCDRWRVPPWRIL